MKNFLRMLGLALLTFVFLGGGRGLFSSAEVNEPSQTFTLGKNVKAIWDQSTQILTIQPTSSGTGKIVYRRWRSMANKLQLRTKEIEKIEFKPGVLLPDWSNGLFSGFKSNIIFPEDQDTHNIVSMREMFSNAKNFNSDLSGWDVSNVTDMAWMFENAKNFNSDLSNWNVGKVTNMAGMFYGAENFNSDLSNWKVGKVTAMFRMFEGAKNFNSDISKWDVSNVTDMAWMFENAKNFNSDLSGWDVSNVTDMQQMFYDAENFNSDLSKWDVSKVTNMAWMFENAKNFNSDLSNWKVGNVTNMNGMFFDARNFNSDISKWDVSHVTSMEQMFVRARNFNSDISKWDVSHVTSMRAMFLNAENFNSDLSNWDFSSVVNAEGFISDISDDNRKMSFSTENYDTLLQKLEDDYLARKLDPRKLRRIDIQAEYCASYPLRDRLKTYGFGIFPDIFNCNPILKINAPTTGSKSEITDTTISFESDFPLNEGDLPAALYVDPSNTTVEYSDFTCSLDSENSKKVDCTIKITSTHEKADQKLTVKFVKELGTGRKIEASLTKSGYTIDQTKPTISDIGKTDSDQGKKWTVSFSVKDEGGAGLWKEDEKNDPKYDDSAITWGIGEDENCQNYQMIGSLDPQSSEPFTLNFEFTDVSQNGKYLCIVAKDKVGNTKTASLAQININLAPTLSDQSVILNENTPVGNEFFTIAGYDPNNGDTLSYTIEEGNTGNVFAINQNKLKVNGKLDYKTLSRYTLMIKVSDQFGLFAIGRYTITLNNIQPSSGGGYSGGGGLSSHTPTSSHTSQASTSCPNGNCSGEPVKTETINTELFNPTIKTSCFSPLDKKTIDQGNKMTELMRIAHQMLYSYQLTKWQGTRDFAPERSLTREEAARFMTEFATNVLCRKPSRIYTANFTDLEDADPTLIPYIKKSYEYLIFNGDDNADGKKEHTKFRPRDLVSVNELAAIMTRLVRNELMEEVKGDWARNYKLYLSSITPKTALVDDIRGNIAEVIYDLYRNNAYELKEVGYVIKK